MNNIESKGVFDMFHLKGSNLYYYLITSWDS